MLQKKEVPEIPGMLSPHGQRQIQTGDGAVGRRLSRSLGKVPQH